MVGAEAVTAILTGDASPLTWLLALGCTFVAWIAGYTFGYRKGVRDAINDDLPKADHRLTED